MNWNKFLYDETERPLDRLVAGYSHTAIFRRIAFIGDSLSSGEFETRDKNGTPGYHDLYEYSWGQYIARKHSLTAYNFSKSGMTAKEYMESFAEEQGFWDPTKACQAYVLALGVNDLFNRHMEPGHIDDIDVVDHRRNASTFAGYYAAIIQRYKEISPDAHFFLVTIPHTDDAIAEQAMPTYRSLLYAIAATFENCYVIDLYQYGPLYDARFREHFYLYGHMNPSGYILTAQLIDSYIDYIVRHNPSRFQTAGLITSGIPYKTP